MAELDFTALNKLTRKNVILDETEHSHTRKNGVIQGFAETVNAATEPPKTARTGRSTDGAEKASERTKTAFKSKEETGYNALYRAAHEYHKKHTPPMVDRGYWMTHTPGEDIPSEAEREYWTQAANDMRETAAAHGNDPFLMGMLVQIYEELEREYKRLLTEANEAT